MTRGYQSSDRPVTDLRPPPLRVERVARPNITTTQQTHRSCLTASEHPATVCVGDVRRCIHGRLQLAYRRYVNVSGCHWRDLHPLWTPVLYRRAARAWATQ